MPAAPPCAHHCTSPPTTRHTLQHPGNTWENCAVVRCPQVRGTLPRTPHATKSRGTCTQNGSRPLQCNPFSIFKTQCPCTFSVQSHCDHTGGRKLKLLRICTRRRCVVLVGLAPLRAGGREVRGGVFTAEIVEHCVERKVGWVRVRAQLLWR